MTHLRRYCSSLSWLSASLLLKPIAQRQPLAQGGLGDEKAWPHLIVVPVVWLVFSDILLQLNLSGEMAGITGVDHELNSALPIPPWTLAIPATFAKSLGVCVPRVNG